MAITDQEKSDGMIWVKSLVSHRTGEGVVEFTWGEKRAQLTCEEARRHALGVLECAEAAETDAFIVEFFHQELGMERDKAIQILGSFRSYREKRLAEKRH